MRVSNVMVVRDEVDIIEVNLRYHQSLGVDEFLVIDNGSSDGTTDVLRRLAGSMPLRWSVDPGPFDQSAMTTALAREAAARGTTWVLPTDADEFWWSPVGLRAELAVDAAAISAPVVNFVQARRQRQARTIGLLRMIHRVECAAGPEDGERLVRSRLASFVEIQYVPKWAVRPNETVVIHKGNHALDGIAGPPSFDGSLQILHAPLRARTILGKMGDHGRRLAATDAPEGEGWHARRWSEMTGRRRDLAVEWAANSARRGTLQVGGQRRRLVRDERLARAVAPFVRSPV